jgi:hypothetical protein
MSDAATLAIVIIALCLALVYIFWSQISKFRKNTGNGRGGLRPSHGRSVWEDASRPNATAPEFDQYAPSAPPQQENGYNSGWNRSIKPPPPPGPPPQSQQQSQYAQQQAAQYQQQSLQPTQYAQPFQGQSQQPGPPQGQPWQQGPPQGQSQQQGQPRQQGGNGTLQRAQTFNPQTFNPQQRVQSANPRQIPPFRQQ